MEKMQSKMYDYICETPVVLKKMIENRKEITKEFVEHFKNVEIDQIYVIGSGTSYHAGVSAKKFLESAKKFLEEILGKKVFCMYPTQFARGEKVFNKKTLVIGMSQGGQSYSTVEGLDAAKEKGLYTAAVSENPTALIFEHAETKSLIVVGNEKCGAKTKGYAGTTMTLMLMVMELLVAKKEMTEEKEQEYIARMENVINNLSSVVKASTEWFRRIEKEFYGAKRIIVVGYDNNYGDVLEGALKILETIRQGVTGYDIEEFFHGIYNSITESAHLFYLASKSDYKLEGALKILETIRQGVTGYDIEEFFHGIYNSITESAHLFYLASKSDYKPRTQKLIEILSEWTPHNYMISSPEDVEKHTEKDLICNFTEDDLFGQWEYIIPLQVVACLGSQNLGINPDIPKDPNFHRRIGSKKLDGIRDQYTDK